MATTFQHGIRITNEQSSEQVPVIAPHRIFVVGTAATPNFGSLLLIQNRRQAIKEYGKLDNPLYTLPYALNAIFDQAGRTVEAYVINVFNWANREVNQSDSDPETNQDIETLSKREGFFIRNVVGTGSDPTPSTGTKTLTTRLGLEAAKDCVNKFGFKPRFIIAPGFSDKLVVAQGIKTIAEYLDAIGIIDAPNDKSVRTTLEGKSLNSSPLNLSSTHLFAIYPNVKIPNYYYDTEKAQKEEAIETAKTKVSAAGSDEQEREAQTELKQAERALKTLREEKQELDYAASPYIASLWSRAVSVRGIAKSASNIQLNGITGISKPVEFIFGRRATEANQLNSQGIMTMIKYFGSNWRSWGNRSLAYPGSAGPDTFGSVKLSQIVIHETLEKLSLQFIDSKLNPVLIESYLDTANAYLRTLIVNGDLINGSELYYEAEDNPAISLASGIVTFRLRILPPPPAENIQIITTLDIALAANLNTTIEEATV